MQRVTLVRYTTKPDRAAENEALSRAVFAQLRSAPPEGVAYALFRDGDEFIHVFLNLKHDDSAPVTELPAFKAFQKGVVERCDVPPQATRFAVQLVDCYGFAAIASGASAAAGNEALDREGKQHPRGRDPHDREHARE